MAPVFGNLMPLFYRIMSFVLSLRTEIPTFLAVLVTFLRSNRGGTFLKLLLSQKLFSFLRLGTDDYHASAFSVLTVLFLLSVASLGVIVQFSLKFLA